MGHRGYGDVITVRLGSSQRLDVFLNKLRVKGHLFQDSDMHVACGPDFNNSSASNFMLSNCVLVGAKNAYIYIFI